MANAGLLLARTCCMATVWLIMLLLGTRAWHYFMRPVRTFISTRRDTLPSHGFHQGLDAPPDSLRLADIASHNMLSLVITPPIIARYTYLWSCSVSCIGWGVSSLIVFCHCALGGVQKLQVRIGGWSQVPPDPQLGLSGPSNNNDQLGIEADVLSGASGG